MHVENDELEEKEEREREREKFFPSSFSCHICMIEETGTTDPIRRQLNRERKEQSNRSSLSSAIS